MGFPGPQPDAPRPSSPELTDRAQLAARRTLLVAVMTILALVISTWTFPWALLAFIPMAAAVGFGIAALVAARGGPNRLVLPAVILGWGLAGLLAMQLLGSAVMWEVTMDDVTCRSEAITTLARDRCEAAHQQAIKDWVARLPGAPST